MTSQENRYIRIAGIIEESIVTVLIQVCCLHQGCKRHCKDATMKKPGIWMEVKLLEIDKILKMLDENPLLDGITLSGGEPPQPVLVARSQKVPGKEVLR